MKHLAARFLQIITVLVGVAVLMFIGDERPPAAFMGLVATLAFLVIAASAAVLEPLLRAVTAGDIEV